MTFTFKPLLQMTKGEPLGSPFVIIDKEVTAVSVLFSQPQ
jgi:hypothetical protein